MNSIRAKWLEASALVAESDVVVFTESKLDDKASLGSLQIKGYEINRQDRNDKGGGVITFCKTSLSPLVLIDLQESYAKKGLENTLTSIKVGKPSTTWVIVGIYRPPQEKVYWFTTFNDLILDVNRIGQAVILGDINADLLNVKSGLGSKLKEALEMANTHVPELFVTRMNDTGGSCLDIVAIPKDLDHLKYDTLDISASDHFPVQCIVRISTALSLQPVYKRSFKKVNMTLLKDKARNIHLEDLNDNPDELVQEWNHKFIQILDELAPVKPYPMKKHRIDWFNDEIKELQKKRDVLAKNLKRQETASDNEKENLRIAKRQVKNAVRRASRQYGLEVLGTKDSRKAWKFLKDSTFTTRGSIPTKVNLDQANDYFANLVLNISGESLEVISTCDQEETFTLKKLPEQEIYRCLKKLNENTSTECDGVPAFLLKSILLMKSLLI